MQCKSCNNPVLTKCGKIALRSFVQDPSYFGFCERADVITFLVANSSIGQCKYILYETKKPISSTVFQAITFIYGITPTNYNTLTYYLHWDSVNEQVIFCHTFFASTFDRNIQRAFSNYRDAISFVIGYQDNNYLSLAEPLLRPFHWNLSDLCSFVIKRYTTSFLKDFSVLRNYSEYQNSRLPILFSALVVSANVDIEYFTNHSNYFGFCDIEGIINYLSKYCPAHVCYYVLFETEFIISNKPCIVQALLFYRKIYVDNKHITEKVLVYYFYLCPTTSKIILCKKDLNWSPTEFKTNKSFHNYREALQYSLGHYTNGPPYISVYFCRSIAKPFVRPFFWNLSDLCLLQLKRSAKTCGGLKRKIASYDSMHPQFLSKRARINVR
jgi:hypothetical protein